MAVAACVWLGAASASGSIRALLLVGLIVVLGLSRRRWVWVLLAFVALGALSGMVSAVRTHRSSEIELPSGTVQATVRIAEDATERSYGIAIAELRELWGTAWFGPRVAVRGLPKEVSVGALVTVSGSLQAGTRRVRDEVVAGTLTIDEVIEQRRSSNPLVAGGNAIRGSVRARYDGSERVDGLLAGFLIGDTDLMLASDEENLRLAGLSHFVAVSGSNVALFLVLWWFVTAPLSIHPRLRVIVGFVGLALFAVITRWEPSVIRASAMAAVPLAGGWFGIPVDPWMALGTAVTVLLLVSGELVASVGFQLSIAATIGVLIGLRLAKGRQPRWLWVPLLTTVGAQAAVAPIILSVFGSIPLAAPVTNLIAAPLVAGATFLAAIGVVLAPLAWVARVGGNAVLWIAEIAATGPQLEFVSASLAALAISLVIIKGSRPIAAAVIIVAALSTSWSQPWPSVATITALDVGQGDAILLQTPDGSTMLVDGGSQPRVLDRALRRHGVRTLDTVVLSHNDLDHAGGLVELVGSRNAGVLLVSRFGSNGAVRDAALQSETPVIEVGAGDRFRIGSVGVEVLSPGRRFASENDGSVVLLLTAGLTVLLPGDIERVGQRELPMLRPDIVVVPHHGSSTTDLRWLASTLGSVGILSYGANTYGHPHPDVVGVLDNAGVDVRSTHNEGDVSIPLTSVGR